VKLTFAIDHTTPGGRNYRGGSTHEVNDADARALVSRGIARRADSKPAAQTSTATAADDKPATAGNK
jgi:hypothetical protein